MSKNSEQQGYERYYNREERLAMIPPGIIKDKPKGFFKNKALNITIINVVFVCIMLLLFTFLTRFTNFTSEAEPEVPAEGNSATDPNFNFFLSGYIFDNNILVSIRIEKKPDSALSSDDQVPVEITITLSGDSDFFRKFFDIMPESPDDAVILRTAIPITNSETHINSILFANIIYDDQFISLNSEIRGEK